MGGPLLPLVIAFVAAFALIFAAIEWWPEIVRGYNWFEDYIEERLQVAKKPRDEQEVETKQPHHEREEND